MTHATENPAAARPRRASVKEALRSARHAVLAKIDAFFFAPDTTPWDIIRIGAALLVLGPLLLSGLSGNYERLYGHWGSLPRSEALDAIYWPGFVFLLNSDPAWIWRIYWATCAAALCLMVGLWTRLAAFATWFLYIATIQRNLMSFNGETGILAFLLLGLALAPAPQRFSIDHLVLKRPLPTEPRCGPPDSFSSTCVSCISLPRWRNFSARGMSAMARFGMRSRCPTGSVSPIGSGFEPPGSAGFVCMGRSRWKAALPSLCGRDSVFQSSSQ